MAVRMPVVIAQHSQRSGAFATFEEELVAELIFANGLDVSLIQSLEHIALASTDHLCLEGFMGSFACLTWSAPDRAAEQLHRLGLQGELSVRDQSDTVHSIQLGQGNGTRKVLHFDLSQWKSAKLVVERLNRILSERSVPVIPILLHSPKGSQAKKEPSSPSSVPLLGSKLTVLPGDNKILPRSSSGSDMPEELAPERTEAGGASQGDSVPLRNPGHPITIEDEEEEWAHLDRLIDDLDSTQL